MLWVQKGKTSRQRDRRTRETQKARHTVAWRRKGTREWSSEAISRYPARAGPPATKIEGQSRKTPRAKIHAPIPPSTPAKTPQERAMQSRQRWRQASKRQAG